MNPSTQPKIREILDEELLRKFEFNSAIKLINVFYFYYIYNLEMLTG